MTFDRELIRQLKLMSASANVVNDSERETIRAEMAYYEMACKLSNGKDKKSNARWSVNVIDSKRRLERVFAKLTGRPYFDMKRFQRLDKCETPQ